MTTTNVISTSHTEALERAKEVLEKGGLIALPTDTVYGLAADAWDGDAISMLYEVKQRSTQKSIPVLIQGASDLKHVAAEPFSMGRALAEKFWPGPLTIVVHRKAELPTAISPTDKVGVRAPDEAFAMRLLGAYGPLAATSANSSGLPDATSAAQVVEDLGDKVDLVLDGGETRAGIPSTVIDATGDKPVMLREGPIPIEAVFEVWESY